MSSMIGAISGVNSIFSAVKGMKVVAGGTSGVNFTSSNGGGIAIVVCSSTTSFTIDVDGNSIPKAVFEDQVLDTMNQMVINSGGAIATTPLAHAGANSYTFPSYIKSISTSGFTPIMGTIGYYENGYDRSLTGVIGIYKEGSGSSSSSSTSTKRYIIPFAESIRITGLVNTVVYENI